MTTSFENLVVNGRFDLYKLDDDFNKSWLFRIIAHWDDRYVYLKPGDGVSPVDVRVDKATGKVYQWLYGGWETSDYQNTDRNPGYQTITFDGMTGDEYWLCYADVDPKHPKATKMVGADYWSGFWRGDKESVTPPWRVNPYCIKPISPEERAKWGNLQVLNE